MRRPSATRNVTRLAVRARGAIAGGYRGHVAEDPRRARRRRWRRSGDRPSPCAGEARRRAPPARRPRPTGRGPRGASPSDVARWRSVCSPCASSWARAARIEASVFGPKPGTPRTRPPSSGGLKVLDRRDPERLVKRGDARDAETRRPGSARCTPGGSSALSRSSSSLRPVWWSSRIVPASAAPMPGISMRRFCAISVARSAASASSARAPRSYARALNGLPPWTSRRSPISRSNRAIARRSTPPAYRCRLTFPGWRPPGYSTGRRTLDENHVCELAGV